MLPQFGYIVAQAGADAHHSPAPSASKQRSGFAHSPGLSSPVESATHYAPTSVATPASLLPPPLPYLYSNQSTAPPSQSAGDKSGYYDTRRRDHGFRPLQPLPPPSAGDTSTQASYPAYNSYSSHQAVWQTPPSYAESHFPPTTSSGPYQDYYDDPYHSPYATRWSNDEISESKILRRIRECNDLVAWMDNEFWEQSEGLYREKLSLLQDELRTIQEGTHAAFLEVVADLESKREQTIENAKFFTQFQIGFTQAQYQHGLSAVEEEYEAARHKLYEMVLMAIEDRRKLVKEDKEEVTVDVQDLFAEVYARISGRYGSYRHESSRRRQNRSSTPHGMSNSTSRNDELDSDLMIMKGLLPARRQGATGSNHNSTLRRL